MNTVHGAGLVGATGDAAWGLAVAGQWRPVQGVRQTRPDHMVEVLVGGQWRMACNLEHQRRHTMGGEVLVGSLVREFPQDDYALEFVG
jgi:hypothetical protein